MIPSRETDAFNEVGQRNLEDIGQGSLRVGGTTIPGCVAVRARDDDHPDPGVSHGSAH